MFTFEKEEPADTAIAIKMVSRVWIDARVYTQDQTGPAIAVTLSRGGGGDPYI